MATHVNLAVFAGDGIGPEVTSAAAQLVETLLTQLQVSYEIHATPIGYEALKTTGSAFPPEALTLAHSADGLMLGPTSAQNYPVRALGGLIPSIELRRKLDLYANILPARTYSGLMPHAQPPRDLVVVRENSEGFIADRNIHDGAAEVMPTADVAMSFRKISRDGSSRIARTAFEVARRRNHRVTAAHKTDMLPVSEGLFLESMRDVATDYPEVEYSEEQVDSMVVSLQRNPDQYDVVVSTNLFGEILAQQAVEIAGSNGLSVCLSVSTSQALAQAQHDAAEHLVGHDQANPTSMMASCGFMLAYLGHQNKDERLIRAADVVEHTLADVLSQPATRTPDVGGSLGTLQYTELVIQRALHRLGAERCPY